MKLADLLHDLHDARAEAFRRATTAACATDHHADCSGIRERWDGAAWEVRGACVCYCHGRLWESWAGTL